MPPFLKNFFKQSNRSVLGIDIGASAIKIVQLSKKKNKASLDTYGALALGPYADMENRIIDLSKAVFKLLSNDNDGDGVGDLSSGLLRVRSEVD